MKLSEIANGTKKFVTELSDVAEFDPFYKMFKFPRQNLSSEVLGESSVLNKSMIITIKETILEKVKKNNTFTKKEKDIGDVIFKMKDVITRAKT